MGVATRQHVYNAVMDMPLVLKTEDRVAGFDFECDANIDGGDAGIPIPNESMFNRI